MANRFDNLKKFVSKHLLSTLGTAAAITVSALLVANSNPLDGNAEQNEESPTIKLEREPVPQGSIEPQKENLDKTEEEEEDEIETEKDQQRQPEQDKQQPQPQKPETPKNPAPTPTLNNTDQQVDAPVQNNNSTNPRGLPPQEEQKAPESKAADKPKDTTEKEIDNPTKERNGTKYVEVDDNSDLADFFNVDVENHKTSHQNGNGQAEAKTNNNQKNEYTEGGVEDDFFSNTELNENEFNYPQQKRTIADLFDKDASHNKIPENIHGISNKGGTEPIEFWSEKSDLNENIEKEAAQIAKDKQAVQDKINELDKEFSKQQSEDDARTTKLGEDEFNKGTLKSALEGALGINPSDQESIKSSIFPNSDGEKSALQGTLSKFCTVKPKNKKGIPYKQFQQATKIQKDFNDLILMENDPNIDENSFKNQMNKIKAQINAKDTKKRDNFYFNENTRENLLDMLDTYLKSRLSEVDHYHKVVKEEAENHEKAKMERAEKYKSKKEQLEAQLAQLEEREKNIQKASENFPKQYKLKDINRGRNAEKLRKEKPAPEYTLNTIEQFTSSLKEESLKKTVIHNLNVSKDLISKSDLSKLTIAYPSGLEEKEVLVYITKVLLRRLANDQNLNVKGVSVENVETIHNLLRQKFEMLGEHPKKGCLNKWIPFMLTHVDTADSINEAFILNDGNLIIDERNISKDNRKTLYTALGEIVEMTKDKELKAAYDNDIIKDLAQKAYVNEETLDFIIKNKPMQDIVDQRSILQSFGHAIVVSTLNRFANENGNIQEMLKYYNRKHYYKITPSFKIFQQIKEMGLLETKDQKDLKPVHQWESYIPNLIPLLHRSSFFAALPKNEVKNQQIIDRQKFDQQKHNALCDDDLNALWYYFSVRHETTLLQAEEKGENPINLGMAKKRRFKFIKHLKTAGFEDADKVSIDDLPTWVSMSHLLPDADLIKKLKENRKDILLTADEINAIVKYLPKYGKFFQDRARFYKKLSVLNPKERRAELLKTVINPTIDRFFERVIAQGSPCFMQNSLAFAGVTNPMIVRALHYHCINDPIKRMYMSNIDQVMDYIKAVINIQGLDSLKEPLEYIFYRLEINYMTIKFFNEKGWNEIGFEELRKIFEWLAKNPNNNLYTTEGVENFKRFLIAPTPPPLQVANVHREPATLENTLKLHVGLNYKDHLRNFNNILSERNLHPNKKEHLEYAMKTIKIQDMMANDEIEEDINESDEINYERKIEYLKDKYGKEEDADAIRKTFLEAYWTSVYNKSK